MRRPAAVLAALALLACGGPAHAAGSHHVVLPDGPGDVWRSSDVTLGHTRAVQPAADVLRARVSHGRHAVAVRMVFDDLQRVDTQWYWYDVRTPEGTSTFVVEAAQGHWRGLAYQEVQGEWVHVPGLRHHVDYARDVVRFRVPRTLLGQPAWVRVRAHNELGTPEHVFFTDNPVNARARPGWTPRLPAR